jgi:exodeoxyribonuclease VII large subunit
VELIVAPSAVQGPEAADEICQAILGLNSINWPGEPGAIDVIIVARGGGSLEELWPFNEERVARAIFGSRIPVITGVGHETDFTIADFVADCRAPTPSAAAELVVPSQQEYQSQVQSLVRSLRQAIQGELLMRRGALDQSLLLMQRASPQQRVEERRQHLDDLARQVAIHSRHILNLKQAALDSNARQLDALSPFSILARGYSVCIQERTGQVVKSATQVSAEDVLQIRVHDGNLKSKVLGS